MKNREEKTEEKIRRDGTRTANDNGNSSEGLFPRKEMDWSDSWIKKNDRVTIFERRYTVVMSNVIIIASCWSLLCWLTGNFHNLVRCSIYTTGIRKQANTYLHWQVIYIENLLRTQRRYCVGIWHISTCNMKCQIYQTSSFHIISKGFSEYSCNALNLLDLVIVYHCNYVHANFSFALYLPFLHTQTFKYLFIKVLSKFLCNISCSASI